MPAATIAICSGVAETSNWPMPVWAVSGSSGSSGSSTGPAAQVLEVVAVEPERLGLLEHLLGADVVGHPGERGVAGVLHRGRERDLGGAARRPALVADVVSWSAARRSRPARHVVVRVVLPVLDRGGGGHQLERRPGRQPSSDRPVDQRLALGRRAGGRRPRRPRRGRGWPACWGRTTAATPSPGSCRCSARSRRPSPRRRRAGRCKPVVRRLLGVGVDGDLHAAALVGLVADQVDQPGHEQPRVVAGEHRVLGLLQAGLAVEGEVSR